MSGRENHRKKGPAHPDLARQVDPIHKAGKPDIRRFHTRWYRVRRLQAASPRTRAVPRRPRQSTPLDDSVGPVPYSRPSPECSVRPPSNCRMSAAKYSGTGAQATSANSGRSPAANTCTNFIGSREMAGRRRIPMLPRTSPGPTVRSRALCREYDRGAFVPTRRQDFCRQWS